MFSSSRHIDSKLRSSLLPENVYIIYYIKIL